MIPTRINTQLHAPDANAQSQGNSLQQRVTQLEAQVTALQDLLFHFTRVGNEVTIAGADVIVDGGNLHVRNALGQTDSVNGSGNIIIGYNELRGFGDDRSGSHMLVAGQESNYTSYGGIVAGFQNTTSGAFSSVTGGAQNSASGIHSSVTGQSNTASGLRSWVTGGHSGTASGLRSWVTGGQSNTASGDFASVTGGNTNLADGAFSSVTGGALNQALGNGSTVSGGLLGVENTANVHPDTHTP